MDVRGDDDRSSELERAREPSHSRRASVGSDLENNARPKG
jgi:hypothetical protein